MQSIPFVYFPSLLSLIAPLSGNEVRTVAAERHVGEVKRDHLLPRLNMLVPLCRCAK